jgi:hypothetical protein
MTGRGTRRAWLVIGLILALVGLVWLGQGVGLIGGSAMTGSTFWAVVGIVLLVAAGVIVLREVRRTG